MPKAFFLEPGLFARCDGLWYEPGILLVVEPGDRVEVFAARDGLPGARRASYGYRQLDTREPPAGLRGDWRGRRQVGSARRRPNLASLVDTRTRHEWTSAPVLA